MEEKIINILDHYVENGSISGNIAVVIATIIVFITSKKIYRFFISKFENIARKKDLKNIVDDINGKIFELSSIQDNYYISLISKLETIENMISIIENSSTEQNVEVDGIQRDVEEIKKIIEHEKSNELFK